MSTLIELFDSMPIYNVFAQDTLHCKRVVFVGGNELLNAKKRLGRYFSHRGSPEIIYRIVKNDSEIESMISELIDQFDDCIIDLTGGSDEAIFAAGRISAKRAVRVIKSDIKKLHVCGVYNADEFNKRSRGYKISDIIELAGGRIRGSGHYNLAAAYDSICDIIDPMMQIVLDYHSMWYKQVRYFQEVLRDNHDTCVTAPRLVNAASCIDEIMTRMFDEGILKTLELGEDKISFCFKNASVRRVICDVGVWLELYVYKTALSECGFDDCGVSVVVDWDGIREEYDVVNEIDVMAQKGARTFFISCKTGPVSVEAVNEISVLCTRLGGGLAGAVVVTATRMSQDNLCVYKRARELGITVVELDDLIAGDLKQILKML